MLRRPVVTTVLLAVAAGATPALCQNSGPDPYQAGLERLEDDDWEGALDVWYAAYDSLSFEGVHDPRIGIGYARVVARHNDLGEYEVASEIYGWGFSGTELAPYLDEVREEVERIAPIMEPEDSAALVELAEDADPEVLRRIRTYWLAQDPTPDSPRNERLMEHWERVEYARANFTRGRYTPYDSDDRGRIYVKYGSPDKKTAGSMGARDDELRFFVPDRLEREALRRYDYGPQFEVWAYDVLHSRDIVYFLFGNINGRGRFQLLESPNDLIPDEAWSAASRGRGMGAQNSGVKAAYYLQYFYYAELAMIGGEYSKRFGELGQLWGASQSRADAYGSPPRPREGDLESLDQRYVQEDRYANTDEPEVASYSNLDDGARAVELVVEPVRTLSPDNEPRLHVVSLSGPRVRVESSGGRIRRRDVVNADMTYRATHTLIVRDEDFREVGRMDETVTPERGDMAVFILRHVPRRLQYSVVVEVEQERENRESGDMRLPGREHFEVGEPLPTDPDALVMSDVVTGVAPTAEEDYENLPFPIIPSRTIWRKDPLRLYVELYHLARDAGGLARYRYDFRVTPGPEGRPLPPAMEPVTLSMDLEFSAATARDVFDIDVSTVPLGPATVTVRATDLRTGRAVERSVPVEIVR